MDAMQPRHDYTHTGEQDLDPEKGRQLLERLNASVLDSIDLEPICGNSNLLSNSFKNNSVIMQHNLNMTNQSSFISHSSHNMRDSHANEDDLDLKGKRRKSREMRRQ